MTVAVLLPVYHGDDPRHFDEALCSIENQVGCDEPIHIYLGVDGPLPSELEEVIDRHRDRLYRVVRHPEQLGPTPNMNRLIQAVEDERLIFRMDADDISMPERFARQIEFMDAHPDIAILGTTIEEVYEDTGESYTRRYPTDPDVMAKVICSAAPLAHPSVCIRPEVFRELGGYPDIRGQDIALWFEALRYGFRISNLEEPLLKLRVSHAFLARRSWLVRAWPEFTIFMRGIWRLHGVTWRYVLPITRFMVKLSGPRVLSRVYRMEARNWLGGSPPRRRRGDC